MDNEITLAFGNLTVSPNSHENLAISSNSQHQEKVPEPTYSILKTKILSSINLIRHLILTRFTITSYRTLPQILTNYRNDYQ